MKFFNYRLFIFLIVISSLALANSKLIQVTSYGKLYQSQAYISSPKSISEVQSLVKQAKAQGQKVTLIGRGLSQGKQSLWEGSLLLNLENIKHMTLDEDVLTVGSGALWQEVQAFINPSKLALKVMQGSNIFSVGGSLSANCHGWDFRTGPISNTVLEMSVVTPDGELLVITPKDSLFHFVLGGYGLFGVIVEAKIKLTPNLPMTEISEEIPLDQYRNYFHQRVKQDAKILMHRYRLSVTGNDFFQTGIATNYVQSGAKGVVSHTSSHWFQELTIRVSLWFIKNFPSTQAFFFKIGKSKLLQIRESTRNEIMDPPYQFHFREQKESADWLQEYFIPENQLEPFIAFLKNVLLENKVPLLNATVRYVKAGKKTPLSYTQKEAQFSVVLYFFQKLDSKNIQKTQRWVQEVIDYLIKNGGSYYLPYQHFPTREQFKKSYPLWEDFKKEKESFDPSKVFYNGFYHDYFL